MKNLLFILMLVKIITNAQEKLIGEWNLWPNYSLERNAANIPGNYIPNVKSNNAVIEEITSGLSFMGDNPTERITGLLKDNQLKSSVFAIEIWGQYHVNQPVGALAIIGSSAANSKSLWAFGFNGKKIDAIYNNSVILEHKPKDGYKERWYQLVLNVNDNKASLYLNGEFLKEAELKSKPNEIDFNTFEISAYMKNEPFMQLSNLVKRIRLFSSELSKEEIKNSFITMQSNVDKGVIHEDLFHFNAGPYLNYSTKTSINLVWETSEISKGIVEYGDTKELGKSIEVDNEELIKKLTIKDLNPSTRYFYKITAISKNGNQKIESGILTFTTAVNEDEVFSFAVSGDTESRPHINDRISKLVWGERPHFMINVGDLTDGGDEPDKHEWNLEYFVGVTQLHSRIPLFPVAGNGEGDLYWFIRYHSLPEDKGYYKFSYGNADYFMLNSNKQKEFFVGGEQYKWLEENLKQSKAKWKFVTHHHAPYSSDEDDYGNTWETNQTNWGDKDFADIIKLYEKYNVDMVFFGHLHSYERSWPILNNKVVSSGGVTYVQAGGAGGNHEDFAPTPSWFNAKKYRGHHYVLIAINNNLLSYKMFDVEGKLIDTLELHK